MELPLHVETAVLGRYSAASQAVQPALCCPVSYDRKLLAVLKSRFKTRLYDAIEGGGSVTLFIDGENIYARNAAGDLFSILDNAAQPLMMMGEDIKLRQLIARERPARRRAKGIAASDKRGASRP